MSTESDIAVYPLAAPSPEHARNFDSLSPDEQLRWLKAAIADGFSGEPTGRTMDELLELGRGKAKAGLLTDG